MRPALVVRRAAEHLERHDVESPLPTAERLLIDVLGTDRADIYRREEPLRSAEARAFGRALCRRCAGVPTQHITGEVGFRRLVLTVRPGVFVPRPETEVVVDAALEVLEHRPDPVVVDVGTGTGAIALAVKQERPDATVWAIDRSSDAIELAEENARRTGLEIRVVPSDLLTGLDDGAVGGIDLVVSNPPYIAPDRYASLPPDVRADPTEAVVGGLDVYASLFSQAAARLEPGGAVVVEIDVGDAASVTDAAVGAGAVETSVRVDLTGRDRVVVATWP
jgi:release factor glutamine methyltransferase